MAMLRFIAALAVLTFTASACSRGEVTIDGAWKTTSIELGGEKYVDEFHREIHGKAEDGKYSATLGAGNAPLSITLKGTYTLDPSTDPKSIDIHPAKDANQALINQSLGVGPDRNILAIYERSGGSLRICGDLTGKSRPTEFKTAKGTQQFLLTLERDDDAR